MGIDSIIIVSGLAAFLAAYSAVRDSEEGCGGRVGPLLWNFSDSWASTSAVIIALVFSVTDIPAMMLKEDPYARFDAPAMLGLGLLMLIAPLIYKGFSRGGSASKRVFLIVSTIMTWSTFAILYMAASAAPGLLSPLPILASLIVYAALALALAGSFINAYRSLSKAAAGDPSEAWTLP